MNVVKKIISVLVAASLCIGTGILAVAADAPIVFDRVADNSSADLSDVFVIDTHNDGCVWTNKSVSATTLDFVGDDGIVGLGAELSAPKDEFVVALSAMAQSFKKIIDENERDDLNVVLVLDNSTSMYTNALSTTDNSSRIDLLRSAVGIFIDSLTVIGDKTSLNISVVAYTGTAKTLLNWTALTSTTRASVRSVVNTTNLNRTSVDSATGNTNAQSGLYLANYMLTEPGVAPESVNDENANNFVIFMSDGGPNRYFYDTDSIVVEQDGAGKIMLSPKPSANLSPSITNTDYQQGAAKSALDEVEKISNINNMVFFSLGLGGWFTTDEESSGFATALNFLELSAGVGNNIFPAEDAKAFCGPNVPYGAMPGANPYYPVTEDYVNFKTSATSTTYTWKDGKTSQTNLSYDELVAKFTEKCGDLETRMTQGINYLPDDFSQAVRNYYAGNTTEKFEASFADIAYYIEMAAGEYVTQTSDSTAADISGYVTITDTIGEYMEIKEIRGIRMNRVFYNGAEFAREMSDPSWVDVDNVTYDNFRKSFQFRSGMTSDKTFIRNMFLGANAAGTMYYNSETDYSNYITSYSDDNGNFLGLYYDVDGSKLEPPEGATQIRKSYAYWGDASGTLSEHAEIFYLSACSAIHHDGIQTLSLSIPASLMPVRTVNVENGVAVLEAETLPISILYTVGLKKNLTNVADDYPYYDETTGVYTFYTNAWDGNYGEKSISEFVAAVNNPYFSFAEDTLLYVPDGKGGYTEATVVSESEEYYTKSIEYNEQGMYTTYDLLLHDVSGINGEKLLEVYQDSYIGEDGFAYVRAGAPKITPRNFKDDLKNEYDEGNASGTADYYHRHTFSERYNEEKAVDEVVVSTLLGNNGKLSLNAADLTITKIWNDGGNAVDTRPDSVTLDIYRDGALYDTRIVSANDCVVSEDGNRWEYTVEKVPFGYDYSIVERDVDGYSTSYSEDGFTITNSFGFENTVVLDYGIATEFSIVPDDVSATFVSAKMTTKQSQFAYGDASVNTDGVLTYAPTTTRWDGYDTVEYELTLAGGGVITGRTHIIPATNIYYEDDFLTFNNAVASWQQVGATDTTAHQDGTDSHIYGFDSEYSDDTAYSNGSAMKVNVSADDLQLVKSGAAWPTATFDFCGTMVDLISYTGGETGFVSIKVTNLDTGKVVKNYGVNTIFEDADGRGDLYQIPVLRCDMQTYGRYSVTISAAYVEYFDSNKLGSYDVYVDAIRVYNPAGVDISSGLIYDKYVEDGEISPIYGQLRDQLVTVGDGFLSNGTANGVMYVAKSDKETSAQNYRKAGPNHEIYLDNSDAIAFSVKDFGAGQKLHISAKAPNGGSAMLTVNGTPLGKVESATEQYFDITALVGSDGMVVIANSGNGILSLVDYKVSGEAQGKFGGLSLSSQLLDFAVNSLSSSSELTDAYGELTTLVFDTTITYKGESRDFELVVDASRMTPRRVNGVWTVSGEVFYSDGRIYEALDEAGWSDAGASGITETFTATWNGEEWVTQSMEFNFISTQNVKHGVISLSEIFEYIIELLLSFFSRAAWKS